ILGLAAAAPRGLDKEAVGRLGGILRQALDGGQAVEHVVARLKSDAARPILTQRQAALLLSDAGQAGETAPFLPSLEQAMKEKDHEALSLLARHFLARHARE